MVPDIQIQLDLNAAQGQFKRKQTKEVYDKIPDDLIMKHEQPEEFLIDSECLNIKSSMMEKSSSFQDQGHDHVQDEDAEKSQSYNKNKT